MVHMRWRCIKCKTTVERENETLTAVYCCGCGVWRKPIRPVGVRVRKPTMRARGTWPTPNKVVISSGGRSVTLVRIPGDCPHPYKGILIEEGPDQNFLFDEPGQSS